MYRLASQYGGDTLVLNVLRHRTQKGSFEPEKLYQIFTVY